MHSNSFGCGADGATTHLVQCLIHRSFFNAPGALYHYNNTIVSYLLNINKDYSIPEDGFPD